MKILLGTSAYFPSAMGGVSSCVTTLSRELARLGHDVTVYTSNAYDHTSNCPHRGTHRIEDVDVVYFRNSFPRRYLHTPGVLPRALRDRRRFDVVHLNDNFCYLNWITFEVFKHSHAPIIFSAHGALTVRMRNLLAKRLFNLTVTGRILRHARAIVALNDFEADQYRRMDADPEKIRIIPLGIAPHKLEPTGPGGFRDKYGITPDETVLLFVGRLHPIKGLDCAIRAVKHLRDNHHFVKFVVVGPKFEDYERLRTLCGELDIAEHVIFTGPLYDNDKAHAFHAADIFVLPSTSDMFPSVALEAASCGLPLVLSDRVMLAEDIRARATVFPSGYDHALASTIETLIENPDHRINSGRQARELINQHYTVTSVAQKMARLYASILS